MSFPLLYIAKILVIILGLLIAFLGGVIGLFLFLTLFLSPEPVPLDEAVTGAACIVLGVGLGGALAWQGLAALRRQASAPFYPLPVWILFIIYLPVIILGQILITFDLFPVLTFPPFHLLGAVIPPFAILAFAGRTLQAAQLRWREIIIQFSGGACLATFLAFTAEIILSLILLFSLSVIFALTPGGAARLELLVTNIQNPLWFQQPENIRQLLLFPPVAITIVTAFVILGPIIEELVKPLGLILMSYRRPALAQAFLWGLAGGAGFALAENLFNTTLALEAWLFIMFLRIGATAMHCLATGLAALGWQHFLAHRRPWKLLGAYSLSVIIHALWNVLVVGVSAIAIFMADPGSEIISTLGGLLILVFLLCFIILGLAIIISLVILTRRLRTQSEPLSKERF